jgi:hypothetical protein
MYMGEQHTDPAAMMTLLAEAFDAVNRRKECAVTKMMAELPPELRSLIERLMSNNEISTRRIHRALINSGAAIGRDAIGDHRAGRCKCPTGGPNGQ